MRTICIYHSQTGNTHFVMEELAGMTGAGCVRVVDRARYGKATIFLLGVPRALSGSIATVDPTEIDVQDYDLVILGTPVWAGRPTPAARAMIEGILNGSEKKVLVVCTSRGEPGDTAAIMAERATAKGMSLISSHHVTFSADGSRNNEEMTALKKAVMDCMEP
ncbi:MAG: ArsR family transcriptional regulator [Methanocalculus sp. MSAO_Arc1]|uniref:flavodoxin family protein n=1 Tax=Methanocalculus TaxID=71151 RepID=UPI000FF3B59D|nr:MULTISPECIES: ArsR family transcriptional regulator [unclassified Methanocalculus]MCP1662694.1 flavodoxin [Methanocalculus sp. AMF5]RQD80278.1 MAG: ArsR family transcriptional regulator [Methanocalculus sp. MSAO_Arc1]